MLGRPALASFALAQGCQPQTVLGLRRRMHSHPPELEQPQSPPRSWRRFPGRRIAGIPLTPLYLLPVPRKPSLAQSDRRGIAPVHDLTSLAYFEQPQGPLRLKAWILAANPRPNHPPF